MIGSVECKNHERILFESNRWIKQKALMNKKSTVINGLKMKLCLNDVVSSWRSFKRIVPGRVVLHGPCHLGRPQRAQRGNPCLTYHLLHRLDDGYQFEQRISAYRPDVQCQQFRGWTILHVRNHRTNVARLGPICPRLSLHDQQQRYTATTFRSSHQSIADSKPPNHVQLGTWKGWIRTFKVLHLPFQLLPLCSIHSIFTHISKSYYRLTIDSCYWSIVNYQYNVWDIHIHIVQNQI